MLSFGNLRFHNFILFGGDDKSTSVYPYNIIYIYIFKGRSKHSKIGICIYFAYIHVYF